MINKVYYNQYDQAVDSDLGIALNWKAFCCIRLTDYKYDPIYKDNVDRLYADFKSLAARYLFSNSLEDLT